MISQSDQATLDSIEALLVAEKASARDALQAAHNLGFLSGQIAMAKVGEQMVRDVMKAAA